MKFFLATLTLILCLWFNFLIFVLIMFNKILKQIQPLFIDEENKLALLKVRLAWWAKNVAKKSFENIIKKQF